MSRGACTQLNKNHLLPALCKALAIEARDNAALKAIRREYHGLNHRLRTDARRAAAV